MKIDNLDLSILKAIISDRQIALDFCSNNDSKLFQTEVWNFAHLLIDYIKVYKELPTSRVLVGRLSKNQEKLSDYIINTYDTVNSFEYDIKEYKFDLDRLKSRFANKEILKLKDNLLSLDVSSLNIDKTISEIQKTVVSVKSLNTVKEYEKKTLKEAMQPFKDEYNAKIENPNFNNGIKTGYSVIDEATGGANPGELWLICAESSAGKSVLMMNMAIQMWMQNNTIDMTENFCPGEDILYFSLEMPYKAMLNRVLAKLSNNPINGIRDAKLDSVGARNLTKAANFIKRYPSQFEIVDVPRGTTASKIERIYEEALTRFNPKIVVVDYMGIMAPEDLSKIERDDLLLNEVSGSLHEMSRARNITVISAAQLNRSKGKETEDRVGLHRIARSSSLVSHVNVAIQIDSRPNERQYPDLKYYFIKNRDGALASGTLIKNLANATLIDQEMEQSDIESFTDYNDSDISERMEKLDW